MLKITNLILLFAMNSIAITNATKTDTLNKNTNLNIGLRNSKIIALGYLPDDEEFTQIEAKNYLIIENTFNLIQGFKSSETLETSLNNGISLSTNSFNSIHFHETYAFFNSFKSMKFIPGNTYILYLTLSELLFIIQESSYLKNDSNFHFIIDITNESLTSIETINLQKNISLGLVIKKNIEIYKKRLTKLIQQEKVLTISSIISQELIPTLYKLFNSLNKQIISKLFNPYFLKKELKNQLLIGRKPNITFIKKSSPYDILCTLKEGEICKKTKGEPHES
jgi:hypothetical protein